MHMKRPSKGLLALLGVLALALGSGAATALYRAQVASDGSAVSALSHQVMDRLREEYKRRGAYPDNLDSLALDLGAADGANSSTLRFVRYNSDGVSFTYGEVGPDAFHQRTWWCYREEHCGALDKANGSSITEAPHNNEMQLTRSAHGRAERGPRS